MQNAWYTPYYRIMGNQVHDIQELAYHDNGREIRYETLLRKLPSVMKGFSPAITVHKKL